MLIIAAVLLACGWAITGIRGTADANASAISSSCQVDIHRQIQSATGAMFEVRAGRQCFAYLTPPNHGYLRVADDGLRWQCFEVQREGGAEPPHFREVAVGAPFHAPTDLIHTIVGREHQPGCVEWLAKYGVEISEKASR